MGQSRVKRNPTHWLRQRIQGSRVLWPILAVFVVPAGRLASKGHPAGQRILVGVLAIVTALIALAMLLNTAVLLAGLDGDAGEIAARLAADVDQRRLLSRWLSRARWARQVGGTAGVLVWAVGLGGHGNLFLLAAGGIALGAFSAEMHHIRRRPGPRVARLEIRTIREYVSRSDERRMLGVAGIAAVLVFAGAVARLCRTAAWWGASAVAVLALARWAQQRVVSRPRPAVSERLTAADDLARNLAVGAGLAVPATFVALALVAEGLFSMSALVGRVGKIAGAVVWLYAILLWWRNRRLGLDSLLTATSPSVLA
jgi:hypothetical protein